MEKIITIDKVDYNVTDEETIHQGDELVFEIKINRSSDATFVVGLWEDLLGQDMKRDWKILSKEK